jgi:hypothetical protein
MRAPHTQLKDKHAGKDIWVVASGASMDHVDALFFENKVAIGINRVYIKFSGLDLVLIKHEQFVRDALESGQAVIMSKHDCGDIDRPENKHSANYIFTHKRGRFGNLEKNFKDNLDAVGIDDDIFVSHSTITSGIHLAAYMGARNIIVCGHDCGRLDGKLFFDGYERLPGWETREKYETRMLGWFAHIEKETAALRKKLREVYGCNIYSLNPFLNFAMEGHIYAAGK